MDLNRHREDGGNSDGRYGDAQFGPITFQGVILLVATLQRATKIIWIIWIIWAAIAKIVEPGIDLMQLMHEIGIEAWHRASMPKAKSQQGTTSKVKREGKEINGKVVRACRGQRNFREGTEDHEGEDEDEGWKPDESDKAPVSVSIQSRGNRCSPKMGRRISRGVLDMVSAQNASSLIGTGGGELGVGG